MIAVAGDTVDIDFRTGKVTVNGVVSDEPYIAEKTERSFDTPFPLTVPQNCVFVMGDNRNHSYDSRYWDEHYVPLENIIAKHIICLGSAELQESLDKSS